MNSKTDFADSLHSEISSVIQIEELDDREYLIRTPLTFDDGDGYLISLQSCDDGWMLTDCGRTYMHLSCYLDDETLDNDENKKVIEKVYTQHQIEERKGALVRPIDIENIGGEVFEFAHAISKIASIARR